VYPDNPLETFHVFDYILFSFISRHPEGEENMAKRTSDYHGFLEKYNQLSPVEACIVHILSFMEKTVPKKSILACLEHTDGKLAAQVGFHGKFESALKNIEEKGFLSGKYKLEKKLCLFGSFMASRDQNAKNLGLALSSHFQLSSYIYRYEQLILKFRIGLFLMKDEHIWNDSLANMLQYHMGGTGDPFVLYGATPFVPEIVSSFSDEIQLRILEVLFVKSAENLDDDDRFVGFARDFIDRQGTEVDGALMNLALHIGVRLIRQGRLDEAAAYSDETKIPSVSLQMKAMIKVFKGDYDGAVGIYSELAGLAKKTSRSKEPVFPGTPGYLYVLARFAVASPAELPALSDYISKRCLKVKNLQTDFGPYYYFERWVNETIFPQADAESGQVEETCHKSSAPTFLYQALSLFGIKGRLGPKTIEQLKLIYGRAKKKGYDGLAMECAELLEKAGESDEAMALEHNRMKVERGYVPLSAMITVKEAWEKKMEALIGMVEPAVETEERPETSSRMIWHLYLERYGEIVLTPFEQKKGVRGQWNKGRAVSLKRLYEKDYPECMTDQDKMIALYLTKDRDWGYIEYFFDFDKALPALVGHPFVFTEHSAGIPVDVMKGEPSLRVKKTGDSYLISFPGGDTDSRSFIEQDAPGRYKVTTLTDDQMKIRDILGKKGVTVPEKGKDRVLTMIRAMSARVLVQSDIDGADEAIETVPSQSIPYIHLFPAGSGFGVSLHVKPFGVDGPLMKPGKGGKAVIADVGGKRLQTLRDLDLEKENADVVVSSCVALDGTSLTDGEWVMEDAFACLDLLSGLKALKDDGKVQVVWPEGEKLKPPKTLQEKSFSFKISSRSDWFDVTGDVRIGQDEVIGLKTLLELLEQSPSRYIPLSDGEFLSLSDTMRRRLNNFRRMASHGRGKIGFHRSAALSFQDSVGADFTIDGDKTWDDLMDRFEKGETFTPSVPSTVTAQLRDYQKDGFIWLSRLSMWGMGACLADDMGLGKTLQVLCVLVDRGSKGPSLVVAPTSVCMNWMDEAARFAPTLTPVLFGAGDREAAVKSLGPMDLLVVSYGLLHQESDLLASVSWNAVVLDEAQAIKNAGTKRSQAAMSLSGGFKVITTGTPVENRLGELKNLFDFINPGLLGSDRHFNETFAVPIEKYKDKETAGSLRNLIRPFTLRRIKTQVLDELPPKTEITLKVAPTPEEATFYEVLRQKAVESLSAVDSGKPGEKHLMILAEITRLRRACCHPDLVMKNSGIESSKLAQFGELVDELLENNHKALVFSQFTGHLAIIRDHLDQKGVTYRYLDGATPAKQRREEVEAFQRGEADLFLISLKAGGMGLNLTAASYVIHMDPWWNPAVEDQASDRAHRIGQTHPVTVYRLVAQNTIEEKIIALHREKRDLAEELLEGGDISGKISAEELLELIRS
jgi:hypothetical protein